jgi:hypothetical protein
VELEQKACSIVWQKIELVVPSQAGTSKMAQSSASPFPPADRKCVIILKDPSINGTKEEIHAENT